MRRLASFGLLCSLLLTSPVSAQLKGNPENVCRNGYFPRESKEYRLAKITGAAGDRIYFHGDDNERCPDDRTCRLKTYVISNDEVIVSRTLGKFACSWFQPRKGSETVGWIETDRLAWQAGIPVPTQRDWLGEWRGNDNVIRISKSKEAGQLAIKGEARWGSGSRSHAGELDYEAKPADQPSASATGLTNATARSPCISSAGFWWSATTFSAAARTCRFRASTRSDPGDDAALAAAIRPGPSTQSTS